MFFWSKIVFTNKNNRYFGHGKKIEKFVKFVLTNDYFMVILCM